MRAAIASEKIAVLESVASGRMPSATIVWWCGTGWVRHAVLKGEAQTMLARAQALGDAERLRVLSKPWLHAYTALMGHLPI